tara:strand:- start:484 stop:1425 length:942 start_codon:yes stop_codon:yes gene_type:complete
MSEEPKKYFEQKTLKSGEPNPKYVDILREDKPVSGQAYGCFSFLSPEKILVQKEHFMFEQFLKGWELNKSMSAFSSFLSFLSYKYSINMEEINEAYEEFIKEETDKIKEISIKDQYQFFLDKNEEELEKKFSIQNKFQTSVRGVKNRGNYPTLEEAQLRAKLLREDDPNFDIFVGPVGTWLCQDPNAYKTGKTEYMEEELNQLAHEKEKNEAIAKSAFDKRVLETKRKAIEDNIEKAKKSGNKLTQTIDKDGNLIGVNNTQEASLKKNENVTSSTVFNELFEGDNIIMKPGDHGESRLTNKLQNSSSSSSSST